MNYTPHPTIVKILKHFAPAQADLIIEQIKIDVNIWYLCKEAERIQAEMEEIKSRLNTINNSLTEKQTQ